ncbi:hypothetical protein [Ktedonobacter robiniae]|uniref:Transposase DDE domain-containing protein n=1 Tax=Ktedonobacter robiniae TaxID=2778365 RepID=A0ABQ3UYU9_9CHLR|nr:hypothetical protein [Ktedonobacter robiniae]GHO57832.1 hypothetical protein KSB_63070 [Ktedonobacter robiniae]
MTSITSFPLTIQTTSLSVPSTPSWFGEVTVIAQHLRHLSVLSAIEERVRLARRRFGHYDLIDFAVVLLGYAISGERTLEAFYERLQPFAQPFMALFGRERLPHRSTLSRFLAALDQASVEALRMLFLEDLFARPLEKEEKTGGLWDRQGRHWLIFDVDGTRQAARQRALPSTPDLPPAQRRLDEVCAPGYLGRKRGEMVRTRTTVLQAHTHQWVGTFSGASGAGNGDYRGELRQAVKAISAYLQAQSLQPGQAVVRLDGQYGNGAIVADLAGLAYVMRGKDYDLLNLPQVQARLAQLPNQQTTHPETGTCRSLFDFPDLTLSPAGPRTRVIIATRPATNSPVKIGTARDEQVYELFYTVLPRGSFTPADVVALYLHRGAFETVLSDEDKEQEPDRWCSHTAWGQEFWLILAQWVWNIRLELGHALHPTAMRTTEFAPASAQEEASVSPALVPQPSEAAPVIYGPPQWARQSYTKGFAGADFSLQPDGTLRCPAGQPLYAQERRLERNGSLRILYAARIGHCRACSLSEQCQESATTIKARRVSAVYWPLPSRSSGSSESSPAPEEASPPSASHPILWGDWQRCFHRREVVKLLRHQRVDVELTETAPTTQSPSVLLLSRAERAHYRLSWEQRLARNARRSAAPDVSIKLFGIPDAFAVALGLRIA